MFTKPREGRTELQLQNIEKGPEHMCRISLNAGGVVPLTCDSAQCTGQCHAPQAAKSEAQRVLLSQPADSVGIWRVSTSTASQRAHGAPQWARRPTP